MKRAKPESIGEVLRNLLEESSMQAKLDELKAAGIWKTIVGEEIAGICRKPDVASGIMTIGVPNAPLRHELMMNRTQLRHAINNRIGVEIIKEIRFVI